jgi:Protein of unknown function (DUF1194)
MKHWAMTLVRCFGALLVCTLAAQSSAQTAAERQTTGAAQPKGPVLGQTAVDLNLVLALDASGSVDDERFELQKQGYVRAFLNPRVLDAIRSGNEQAISVSMVQWTGPTLHEVMVPWMVVRDEASARAFGAAINAAQRRLHGGGTSVSGAIDFSVMLLNTSPYRATRRVIDISGDGSNNLGRPPEQARDEAVAMGIRINGLPILMVEPDLDQYFRESVIGGPGAFVIVAQNYEQFADAILRKLVTEISSTGERRKLVAQ